MDAVPTPLDPEQLLERTAFIRSVAAALLRDRDAVDDVVQETWVRAVARPPRAGWRLEAWLAGVAGNVAHALRRNHVRRVRREQAGARPEALPSTADTVARLETLRSVVEAVAELEEPYRQVVLLRHFDDLPPREIASALGVPVETVRTRLRRALEQLRGRLDARHAGDRRAWSLGLLPLIQSEAAAGAVAGGSLYLLAGALLMKTKLILAGAAALLLAVLTFVWAVAPDGPRPVPLSSAGGVAASAADPNASEPSADPTQFPPASHASREPGVPSPGGSVVRGIAVRGSGSEVFPRAHLRARAFRGTTQKETVADVRLVAGEQGEFAWTLDPAQDPLALVLDGAEDGHFANAAHLFVAPGDPPAEPCEVRFHALDCRVSGTVRDAAGQPIKSATVRSSLGAVATDERGAFTAALALGAPSTWKFDASAPGFSRAHATVHPVGPGNHLRLDFHLRVEARLSGSVRDERGDPIEGAEVTAADEWVVAHTDAKGAFELRELDPTSETWSLRATCEGYLYGWLGSVVRGASEPVVIVLKRGTRVEGVVLDPSGVPQPGAFVFFDAGPVDGMTPSAVTSAAGSFVLPCVPSGPHQLFARRRGVGIARSPLEVPAGRELVVGTVLQLAAVHFLAGQVFDQGQNPLGSVSVGCSVDAGDRWVSVAAARTGKDGRFRVEGLPGGSVAVSLAREGFFASEGEWKVDPGSRGLRQHRPEFQVDRDDLLLTMDRAGGLAGRVQDATSGKPIGDFRVRFGQPALRPGEAQPAKWNGLQSNWFEEGRRFSGTGGAWNTVGDRLSPGIILGIEVTAPGYAPWADDHVVVATEPEQDAILARLLPAATLSGRVLTDASGEPVAGATVTVFTEANPLRPLDPMDRHAHQVSMTDSEGRFRLEDVPAGELSLAVKPGAGAVVIDGPFRVPAGVGTFERIVRLHGGGRIEGVVTGDDGLPVGDAQVLLRPSKAPGVRDTESWSARSDAAGRFVFAGVATGEYFLAHVLERGAATASVVNRGVSVLAPDTTRVELHPRQGTASLRIERKETPGLAAVLAVNLVHAASQAMDSKVAWDERTPMRGGFVEEGKPLLLRGLAAGEYMLMTVPFGRLQKVVLTQGQLTSVTIPP